MNINIRTLLHQVIDSAKRLIELEPISLTYEVDAAIPVSLSGKQLPLTHILHGLIDDAVLHVVKGKITIKARLLDSKNEKITVGFIVAYTGTLQPTSTDDKTNANFNKVLQLKRLVEKQGGDLEIAMASGLGKQYKFSLTYQQQEAIEPVVSNRGDALIDALWSLSKMFSHLSPQKAFN